MERPYIADFGVNLFRILIETFWDWSISKNKILHLKFNTFCSPNVSQISVRRTEGVDFVVCSRNLNQSMQKLSESHYVVNVVNSRSTGTRRWLWLCVAFSFHRVEGLTLTLRYSRNWINPCRNVLKESHYVRIVVKSRSTGTLRSKPVGIFCNAQIRIYRVNVDQEKLTSRWSLSCCWYSLSIHNLLLPNYLKVHKTTL